MCVYSNDWQFIMTDNIRLVVVDDHGIVREGLVSLLNAQDGIEVVGDCGDANSALDLVRANKPDVLLTDINMPGSCPFEMAKQCLEFESDLKVIFLTAYGTDGNLDRAIKVGGSGFIAKEEPITSIIEAVRAVHEGNEYISEELRNRLVSNQNGEEIDDDKLVRSNLLSTRELEVLRCVARGMTAKIIAKELSISAKTVERHKSNIMSKLGIHSQVELTRYAIREGLINI